MNGRISYPQDPKTIQIPVPVLIGAHAMGRSQIRWWQDSFKDRATFEQTDKITAMALAKGYAVVAIDARHHGLRKDPDLSVVDIIDNLHWWGERELYETMLVDTVRDHRVLLDWLVQQPMLDKNNIKLAGYSMGAINQFVISWSRLSYSECRCHSTAPYEQHYSRSSAA